MNLPMTWLYKVWCGVVWCVCGVVWCGVVCVVCAHNTLNEAIYRQPLVPLPLAQAPKWCWSGGEWMRGEEVGEGRGGG